MNEKIIIGILLLLVFTMSGGWYKSNSDAGKLRDKETKYIASIAELTDAKLKADNRLTKLESELKTAQDTAIELRKRIEQLQVNLRRITETASAIDAGIDSTQGTVAESRRYIEELTKTISGL